MAYRQLTGDRSSALGFAMTNKIVAKHCLMGKGPRATPGFLTKFGVDVTLGCNPFPRTGSFSDRGACRALLFVCRPNGMAIKLLGRFGVSSNAAGFQDPAEAQRLSGRPHASDPTTSVVGWRLRARRIEEGRSETSRRMRNIPLVKSMEASLWNGLRMR